MFFKLDTGEQVELKSWEKVINCSCPRCGESTLVGHIGLHSSDVRCVKCSYKEFEAWL